MASRYKADLGDRHSTIFVVRLLALLLMLYCAGCKVGPDYKTPSAKVAHEWMTTTGGETNESNAFPNQWWRILNDPVLNHLVDAASTNNLSLQIAGVRILQARARLNQSVGNLFPQQQGVSGDIQYRELNDPIFSTAPGVSPNYASDQILFAATWEIDVWGKFRRGIESDQAEFLSTIASYDDALVTLIADVAGTYVNIRTLEERLRVANQNIATLEESLRVATAQYNAGETSKRDVLQAKTVLAQTQAVIPTLQSSLDQNKTAMAVLLGETPDKVDGYLGGPGAIPLTPTNIVVGIPKDLLRRRPDVREAGLNAAAQCALIGVARAQMYPAFSLSGAFGFSSNDEGDSSLADMFSWESRAVKAGASFFFPIFNYGRLVNQVRVQDAEFQQAILNYQNTVLEAQQDVENGLAAFVTAQQSLGYLGNGADFARESTQLAMIQYKGGETDYTTVLTAEQSQLSIDDTLASTQGSVVQGLIMVYRALGGGWEQRLNQDVVSDSVKSEMADRTNWGKLLDTTRQLPDYTEFPSADEKAIGSQNEAP